MLSVSSGLETLVDVVCIKWVGDKLMLSVSSGLETS